MRRTIALPFVAIGAALALADAPALADDDAAVVATVGTAEIAAVELEQRLAEVPSFQLNAFGATPAEVKKGYLEKVLIPAALYAEAARAEELDEDAVVRDRIREVLRRAIENDVREDLAENEPVTDAQVKRYYEQHRSKFVTPRRMQLWRILVDDKALAEKIIGEVQAAGGDKGPKKWSELARKHSVDEATKMREGNLGFVKPDGSTNMPRVRVDPKLFEAADRAKDGELLPEPIEEKGKWAVVWRRGGIKAVVRSLEDETNSIKQILARERIKKKMDDVIEGLWKERVSGVNDALLEYVNVMNSGDVTSRPRPGTVPRRPPRGSLEPKRGDRGNR